jgi:hypothetical protein
MVIKEGAVYVTVSPACLPGRTGFWGSRSIDSGGSARETRQHRPATGRAPFRERDGTKRLASAVLKRHCPSVRISLVT